MEKYPAYINMSVGSIVKTATNQNGDSQNDDTKTATNQNGDKWSKRRQAKTATAFTNKSISGSGLDVDVIGRRPQDSPPPTRVSAHRFRGNQRRTIDPASFAVSSVPVVLCA